MQPAIDLLPDSSSTVVRYCRSNRDGIHNLLKRSSTHVGEQSDERAAMNTCEYTVVFIRQSIPDSL